ncbi:MAG: hypothetical protein ACREON_01175, partial [Gemmatimonadaceae bacterium]
MTRIGLAYNQKPEKAAPSLLEISEAPRPEDEPPSTRRDVASRTTPAALLADDEYAEWDEESTIAAVEAAIAGLGEPVRLEANEDFPEQLRAERPDIVFNMAEGLLGVNREAHVPAICEFFGVPYSGSDPFTLSLCLDKARTKEVLSYHAVPTAPFALVRDQTALAALRGGRVQAAGGARAGFLRFPVFVKPVHEGSSKGITEQNFCRT